MSLDGISKKSVPPALRLASTNAKPANTEAGSRRPSADDTRLAGAARPTEPALQSDPAAQAARRYPRFVPSAHATQVVLDLLLISETQGIVLFLIYGRLGLESITQAAVVVGFSVMVVS